MAWKEPSSSVEEEQIWQAAKRTKFFVDQSLDSCGRQVPDIFHLVQVASTKRVEWLSRSPVFAALLLIDLRVLSTAPLMFTPQFSQ